MNPTWSYSSISLFKQCKKKYYHLRVVRDITEPTSEQMIYGLEVHKAAELYIGDGEPLPPMYTYMKDALDALNRKPGDKYCEYEMALTRDLEPCDFDASNRWWRGIADLLIVNGSEAKIVDYKTGKAGYPDTKQLEILALALFKHFPDVQVVKAGLLFVVHDVFVPIEVKRIEEAARWKKWTDEVSQLEQAHLTGVWNPVPNFTCRGWCPVKSCDHWQPRRSR